MGQCIGATKYTVKSEKHITVNCVHCPLWLLINEIKVI